MRVIGRFVLRGMLITGALFFLPSQGETKTVNLSCGGSKTISAAVAGLNPGDVLRVNGTYNEHVVIQEDVTRVTIDGQGTAVINGIDPNRHTVVIRGSGITITGFMIVGGQDGINVNRGGVATISNNIIGTATQPVGRDAISVNQGSIARITNNILQNASRFGIIITQSATARVGFLTFDGLDTVPGGVGPNTIQNNVEDGIRILRASSGVIINNVIRSNGGDGVRVARASHADISSNAIEANGGHGINVIENSGVNLGTDSGSELDNLPNSTGAGLNNGGFGISCGLNSSANGRLGTLNGTSGPADPVFGTANAGCVNSLN